MQVSLVGLRILVLTEITPSRLQQFHARSLGTLHVRHDFNVTHIPSTHRRSLDGSLSFPWILIGSSSPGRKSSDGHW